MTPGSKCEGDSNDECNSKMVSISKMLETDDEEEVTTRYFLLTKSQLDLMLIYASHLQFGFSIIFFFLSFAQLASISCCFSCLIPPFLRISTTPQNGSKNRSTASDSTSARKWILLPSPCDFHSPSLEMSAHQHPESRMVVIKSVSSVISI